MKRGTTCPELHHQKRWMSGYRVHIVISNFKRFILGTYHGVSSRHVQEYINEFCYRFNRQQWEFQIPNRLLAACAAHLPVKIC